MLYNKAFGRVVRLT